MTQKCSDLMAALKKQDIQFITANSMRQAIDSIEISMGPCWTDARGSRHVAHKMLEDDYLFVTRYYSITKGDYVETYAIEADGVYYDTDGDRLEPVKGYRPLTVAERQEREAKHVTIQTRNHRDRRIRTRRSRSRRLAEDRRSTPTAPITVLMPAVEGSTKEPAFSRFITSDAIERHRIGELSLAS